jgi:uncharacterized protein (DUF1778 family)
VRHQRLEARVTPEQKELLQRAASLQGRSLADFVVASAQEAALRAIQDMEIIRLSAADSRVFAEALLNPPKPNRALRNAAKRYRALIGD